MAVEPEQKRGRQPGWAPSRTASGRHERAQAELAIGGMTCASCVARIERKLGKLTACARPASTWPPSGPRVTYDPARGQGRRS